MTIHPRYTIDTNERTGLVRIAILGFWDLADVATFAEVHGREVRRVANAGRILRTLVDYLRSAIQSQQVDHGMAGLAAAAQASGS